MDMKSLLWLRWSEKQCRKVPFILKVNIDTFVDLLAFAENLSYLELNETMEKNSESFVICDTVDALDEHDAPVKICNDDVYLMSNKTRTRLLLHWINTKKEDINAQSHFMSTVLAKNANVTLQKFEGLTMTESLPESFETDPIVKVQY